MRKHILIAMMMWMALALASGKPSELEEKTVLILKTQKDQAPSLEFVQSLAGKNLGPLNFSAAVKMPSFPLDFGTSPENEKGGPIMSSPKASFGLQFTLKQDKEKRFGSRLLFGNLNFSRGISTLKDPLFTLSNPLNAPQASKPGIKASIPGDSVPSEKPLASCLSLSRHGSTMSGTIDCDFHAFITQTAFFGTAASVVLKNESRPIQKISVGLTALQMQFQQKNSSYWYMKEKYIPETRLSFFLAQISATGHFFVLDANCAACQNPLGGFIPFLRGKAAITLRHFSMETKGFWTHQTFVTADGNRSRTPVQFSINPQFTFSPGKFTIRLGLLGALEKIRDYYSDNLYFRHTLVFQTQTQLNKMELDIYCRAVKSGTEGAWTGKTKLQAQYPVRNIRSITSASLSWTEKSLLLALKEAVEWKNSILPWISGTLKIAMDKNMEASSSGQLSIKVQKAFRRITARGELKVNVPF